jgi:hypothetical protein
LPSNRGNRCVHVGPTAKTHLHHLCCKLRAELIGAELRLHELEGLLDGPRLIFTAYTSLFEQESAGKVA